MPKITVIMPSLNVASYMRQCLRSVLEQTLEDIEVVAVDVGSTDGTLEILQEYVAADRRISVISGLVEASSAIQNCQFEYFCVRTELIA